MSREHSFTITISNNRTEKLGLEYLRASDPRFVLLDRAGRAAVMAGLEIPKRFARTFDLVYLRQSTVSDGTITVRSPDTIDLVEVKTTKKRLPAFPSGFFFGATQNEFELAQSLGDRYKFCLVSLHPESRQHRLLSLEQLEKLIRTKRVQYQINL